MKIAEMRELTQEELQQNVTNARKELFEARMKHSTHQLDNTSLLSSLKHRISQLQTVIR